MQSWLDLLILGLAVWRFSSLLVQEGGPWDIFARLRHRIGVRYDAESLPYGRNEFAKGIVCTWCISVWLGLIATAMYLLAPRITVLLALPFALSAFAIVIDEKVGD